MSRAHRPGRKSFDTGGLAYADPPPFDWTGVPLAQKQKLLRLAAERDAAPEMAELLRGLLIVLNKSTANIGDVRARMNLGGLGALLARIDTAR